MAYPQVTVVLKGGQAEFRSHGPESDQFAEYLSKMFDQCNNPGAARAALMAKAALGDTVLQLRRAQEEKIRTLKDIADKQDERSRRWDLSPEIRRLAADRADAARNEIRALSVELGQ